MPPPSYGYDIEDNGFVAAVFYNKLLRWIKNSRPPILALPRLAQGNNPDTDARDVITDCVERLAIEIEVMCVLGLHEKTL